jgi:uncharacterized protein (TIGR04255 family)
LVETYAELHLQDDALSQARFFDVVPQLKALGFSEIELATTGLTLDIKQGRPSPRETQRVRCWKPGRTELVQVGEDLLAVNLTGHYPGWDAFVDLFGKARNALAAGLGGIVVRSLNFAAIDRFTIPQEGFSFSDYLNVGGSIVPRWYADCAESLDLDMGRGLLERDGHNRQVHIEVRMTQDSVQVTMRTQFHDRVTDGVDLSQLLSRLHAESNETFEAMITDKLRTNIMGGTR